MLNITKEAEAMPTENIVLTLYGPPGCLKTSSAFTAESPLLLDFDGGAHRAIVRRDTVRINAWPEVQSITAADLEPYRTVVVDTAGRMVEIISEHVMGLDPKNRSGRFAPSLQGWGVVKGEFRSWVRALKALQKDIVFVLHSEEQRKGDDVMERLEIAGASKNEVHRASDAMGRMKFVKGALNLLFSPDDSAFGKNPAQLPPIAVPNLLVERDFLAGIIAKTKEALNRQTEAMRAEQEHIDNRRAQFLAYAAAEDFTAAVDGLADEKPVVKALLVAIAQDKGYVFDKASKTFAAQESRA